MGIERDEAVMARGDSAIQALREAIAVAPDNVQLRRQLAEALRSYDRPAEAEVEYRAALALAPNDPELQLGLARAYDDQGKESHSLVMLEHILGRRPIPPDAHLLLARILQRKGDIPRAIAAYRNAVEADDDLADPFFAKQLGVAPDGSPVYDDPYDHLTHHHHGHGHGQDRRHGAAWNDPGFEPSPLAFDQPRLTFDEVGGMESIKEAIRLKIIHPITHPDIYRTYNQPIGGGILMYGPPGCGKTHLARATAGEISAGFLAVGIHDILEMWIGNSERNLHGIFDQARRNTPCVLFFDEVDALAASRSDLKGGAGARQLVNQFLAELDGIQGRNAGVLVLAATNAPWHLDPAFRRPGRFDRILFVPPPDMEARASILGVLLWTRPARTVDYYQVARKTDGFSGADLAALVEKAVENRLQDAIKSGEPKPITTRDLLDAAATIKPSTRDWFATARNYALYSNLNGVYDDLLRYLQR